MAFTPSLQAFISANTNQSSVTDICAVDWTRNNVYIKGLPPGAPENHITSIGFLSGAEQATKVKANYTVPGTSVDLNAASPATGVDSLGRVYIPWNGGNGGGLIQTDSALAQITYGGADSLPPGGFFIQNGQIANVMTSGNTEVMVCGQSGPTGAFQNIVVYDQVTLLNYYASGHKVSYPCAQKIGTDKAFVLSGPDGPFDPQTMDFYEIVCYPTVSKSTIATYVPSDIDAGWTQIFPTGICVDQTDGNPIFSLQGQSGAPNNFQIIKVDKSTGAIIWSVPITTTNTAVGGGQLQFSKIFYQTMYLHTSQGSTSSVWTINTDTGASSHSTAGYAGVLAGASKQCSNDVLGCIILNTQFGNTVDSPVLLNSTPTSFTGWGVMYVAPPITPPAGSRRFLAQCGPVRVAI